MIHRSLMCAAALLFFSCGNASEKPASTVNACASVQATHNLEMSAAPGNRFLVKLRRHGRGAMASSEASLARALGQTSSTRSIAPDLVLVTSTLPATTANIAARLADDLYEYEYVEPDYQVRTTLASNDEFLPNQWAHAVVQSPQAWDISRGSSSVVVAILDTGIDLTHNDLIGNLWTNSAELINGIDDDGNGYVDDVNGWNFAAENNRPVANDANFHGTHVSGTVGAVGNNTIGISGHAQEVRIMPLKFLDDSGSGYTSDAIRSVDYAVAKGAKVINNSWGGIGRSLALAEAIDRAAAAGVLFVAAAGNAHSNNDRVPFYPANYTQDNVVTVAASTNADRLSSFSNYGASLVHLAAPGSRIHSTKNGNAYQTMSGTSMATPLVSGVLATMIAARPDLSYHQIKGALLSAVDEVPEMKGKVLWNGRINAFRALSIVAGLDADWQPPVPPPHECP